MSKKNYKNLKKKKLKKKKTGSHLPGRPQWLFSLHLESASVVVSLLPLTELLFFLRLLR